MPVDQAMTKDDLVQLVSSKLKVIRAENDLSQEKMADLLGLSKKTLVQIEKGRVPASWSVSIAVCSLFRESEVLQSACGGNPFEVIEALMDIGSVCRNEKTLGGKIWWKIEKQMGKFRLQRNVISGHYRILDDEDYRWCSSFDREHIMMILKEVYQQDREG